MVSWRCWFRIQNLTFEVPTPKSIFGQIWAGKVKVSCFVRKLAQWYLKDADSYSNNSFLNFQSYVHFCANLGKKSQYCLFCLKIGTHVISRMLILIQTLVFWISNSKSIFGQIWAKKYQSCSFCLKICAHGILRMLILILTLVFWLSKPKSIFGQIYDEKLKSLVWLENWHTHYLEDADSYCDIVTFSEFPTLNLFLAKFGLNISKLFVLNEN